MWVSESAEIAGAGWRRPGAAVGAGVGGALALADALFAAGVVAPAVVGYWRGTWGLMDLCVGWAPSLAAGLAGHMLFTLGQRRLAMGTALPPNFVSAWGQDTEVSRCRNFAAIFISRIYTALFGFCCVNAWRGTWKLLDVYCGVEPHALLATGSFGIAILIATRTLRNISAPPFVVATDTNAAYFDVPTMFRITHTRLTYIYVLDCTFSVLFVGTLVVFVWRGAWTLLDIYLYPETPKSSWMSLGLGYVIAAVTFLIQPLMKSLCAHLTGISRILVADMYLFFSFCGTVNIWRGFWIILNDNFLPDNEILSCWITHIGCLLILMMLHCSNSILVRGVYKDGEEEGGKCVILPTQYLRHFFSTQEQDRNHSQQAEQMLPPTVNISTSVKMDITSDLGRSQSCIGGVSSASDTIAAYHN